MRRLLAASASWLFAVLVLTLASVESVAEPAPEPNPSTPYRLNKLIPGDRFSLTASIRLRYEYLDSQFRRDPPGVTLAPDSDAFVMKTRVHGRVRLFEGLTAGAELMDSRAYLVQVESPGLPVEPISTATVNAVELLRAYLQYERADLWGGDFDFNGGRVTMDVGSRRFVASNRFRNTVNAFTGLDFRWIQADDDPLELRAFWTLPVQRRPRNLFESARLRRNDIEFDYEDTRVQFWGLFGGKSFGPNLGELFVLGIHEKDAPGRPTRNRNFVTWGGRFNRKASAGGFDLEFEFAVQQGTSRGTTSGAVVNDLDHFAHFEHLAFGYTFDTFASPRIIVQYDYASGDGDPNDAKIGRFDTLFGARRFEFGPTSIYGAFARTNINTPGIRLQVKPHRQWTAFAAYRAFWLASKFDAWVPAGIRDATGSSGSFVGSQIEFRIRYRPLPGNILLEVGYAHLFDGEFMRNAPTSPNRGDANYAYAQMKIEI